MLKSDILLLVGIIILQVCLVGLLFSVRFLATVRSSRISTIGAFLVMNAVSAGLIMLGDVSGVRSKLATVIPAFVVESHSRPPENFEPSGDPLLIQWVEHQKPMDPRPDCANPAVFRSWQENVRQDLLTEVFRFADIASPVDVRSERLSSTEVDAKVKRIFLSYQSHDGTSIPAYLFLPSGTGRKPAILVLHGHLWNEEGQGITQTAGIVDSYQHANALRLAQAGYVTLTIEFRGFGYLGGGMKAGHQYVAYNAFVGGSFYKAMVSRDIKYAVDLLQSLKEVDPQRIGITGASFGGEMAVTYAALDKRIKAVVFQAFGGNIGLQRGIDGKDGDESAVRFQDHVIPGLNGYLYEEDLFLLIAPRPLLGVRGDRDYVWRTNFPEIVGGVYRCLAAPLAFRFSILPGGHEYFVQPAAEFFAVNL
jgi:dienelactone hydrolase